MWTEVLISIDEAHAEDLSDALMEAGALSVSVEDENADTDAEVPLYGEPGMEPTTHAWQQSRLVVLVEPEADIEDMLAVAFDALDLPVPAYITRKVEAQDWVRLTQSQFEPIEITRNLWIVPTWHNAEDEAERINLRLDPGLAFGTGSHPTTRLCLQWLAAEMPKGVTVLDYGCGSGILAIAAKKLGAGDVIGTDIDPQAVQSAIDNASANDTQARFVLPDGMVSGSTYQVVVANILSNPLKLLAPALVNYVAEGGHLVLSGILERQTEELIEAYSPYMKMALWRADDGWIALVGQKV
ncbi:50S ribosomal protein L11 methyltransferase [Hydromonas duriensis]|uniref:Ribosomal protein L11 methyltransferase n=1 Tax=Hydromonas duriensis TaxID=1527608 RepID=A0A4R6YAC4_9BURK|nr:50S ribosomal protein L11 methyltransferase [Hydromonas duriensis]TDR32498.1 [LSU ribosomal protein L11P]-lysine N-methyltransferase [Hydromonas duriensis]